MPSKTLGWRSIGEFEPGRSYDIAAAQREDADRIGSLPDTVIGRCLGLPDNDIETARRPRHEPVSSWRTT